MRVSGDYSWVTDEMFNKKLRELVDKDLNAVLSPFDELMSIDADIYSILAEYYNNEVLDALSEERR